MKIYIYIFSAILAFTIWGIFPIIYKVVKHIPAIEILSFRVVVSFFFLLIFAFFTNNLKGLFKHITFKNFVFLVISTILVGINWFIFISGSISGNVINVSFGYFICPIIDICLGVIILREKLSIYQKVGLFLTIIGILVYILNYGMIPYIGLILAVSFSFYTLIRKTIQVKPLHGLIFETILLSPFFLAYLIYLYLNNNLHFDLINSSLTSCTLLFIGCLSPFVMFLYLFSSKKLSLSTIGFLHYIEPTILFFLGTLIFKEPFNLIQFISFSFIWSALALISFGPYFKNIINNIKKNSIR